MPTMYERPGSTGRLHLEDPTVLEDAWQALPGGPAASDPTTGEVWQYMGTVDYPTGRRVREFRHRCHPATGRRELARIVTRVA